MNVIDIDDARRAVRLALQAIEKAETWEPQALVPAHDRGPGLRPHTIPGWWQVWSGGLCIALLTPKDVAPLREAPQVSADTPKPK